jgi:hypothetical protein
MRAFSGWLAALALSGGAAFATALPCPPGAAAATAQRGAPVALVSPEPAVPLAGGSTAVLEWTPAPGLERLPASEEWEAFLSLDGGRSYRVRITPHLDRDLRRIRWAVPNLPARDARLLLRFGDERHETVVELPQRFSIVADAPGAGGWPERAAHAAARGEAARPGEPGVVTWVEGSRRGAGERRVAADPSALGEEAPPPALSSRRTPLAATAPAVARAAAPRAAGSRSGPSAAGPPPPRNSSLPPVDRLLQTGRRNE